MRAVGPITRFVFYLIYLLVVHNGHIALHSNIYLHSVDNINYI